MKPEEGRERKRLNRREDFEQAYREGRRVVSPFFVAFVRATGLGCLRVGVVASRRVGGSVARNRAKRLLREAFRRSNRTASVSADVVLVARQAIGEAHCAEVERACSRGLGHILERLARSNETAGGRS
ncbi:MAG TPA: ribonuclease P protein component [Vicinamibacteria bacterium]|nr:ribonuclease P protein component [Vicinamibacteria bacterium]